MILRVSFHPWWDHLAVLDLLSSFPAELSVSSLLPPLVIMSCPMGKLGRSTPHCSTLLSPLQPSTRVHDAVHSQLLKAMEMSCSRKDFRKDKNHCGHILCIIVGVKAEVCHNCWQHCPFTLPHNVAWVPWPYEHLSFILNQWTKMISELRSWEWSHGLWSKCLKQSVS